MPPAADLGTTIRLFLSSTFADFQIERNVLQRRVFPELRRLCAAAGFRFQPIDLRWGVSESANSERQTLRICFDELDRCQAMSPDCFLLILLGERYGSCLLPPEIPAAVVAELQPYLAPNQRIAFDAVYRLDENALPAEYVLLAADGLSQAGDDSLRQVLAQAAYRAELSESERLPFLASATHREIHRGLLRHQPDTKAEAGVLAALRSFASVPVGSDAARYTEEDAVRSEQLRHLRTSVAGRLPVGQVLRYALDWAGTQPDFDEAALAEDYLGLLRPKLEEVMAARRAVRYALAGEGQDTIALTNNAFEMERAAQVVGRAGEMARLFDYVAGVSGAGLPLVVTGPAGSGKSTLLAETTRQAITTQQGAMVIARYIGMTPGTASLVELLNDLRQAIAQAYGQPDVVALTDLESLVAAVADQLATSEVPSTRPLLLIVDALDQLGAQTQRLDWLPPRLAPNVRFVFSLLEDRPELSFLEQRLPDDQLLRLAPLDLEAGRSILRGLLAAEPRRVLTVVQEEAVLSAFGARGLPLHLRLAATQARRWRSFDLPWIGARSLPEATPELLQAMLERLEAPAWLGRVLVGNALGDLAVARFGLAEDELLDLLALDGAVRTELAELSPYSPTIEPDLPLPVALWSRLLYEIDPLLTERAADQGTLLITFYHQQLRTAVETRYLAGSAGIQRHQALAAYFAGQPWRLDSGQWNWRKIRELVTQYEGAGDRAAAEQALSELAGDLERAPRVVANDRTGITALVNALRDRIFAGGYWRVGQRLYARELETQRELDNRLGQGTTLTNLGLFSYRLGRVEAATQYFEQALAILRETDYHLGIETTLSNLGSLATYRGQVSDADRYYQQALAIEREMGDRTMEATTLNNLGKLANTQGHMSDADRYYQQALAIARELGERSMEATTLNNLGKLAANQGRPETGIRFFKEALALLRETGNRSVEGTTLNNLGAVAYQKADWQESARYYQQALAIAREIGDRAGEGTSLSNLGQLANRQRRFEEAASYYEQALTTRREAGDRPGEGSTLNNLGVLALHQGHTSEAAGYFDQALAIEREVGDRASEASTLNNLGQVALNRNRLGEAIGYYQRALTIHQEVGDRAGEGRTLYNLGAVAFRQSQLEVAARYYDQALASQREVGDRAGEALILNNLGTLATKQNRLEAAAVYFEQALAIVRTVGELRHDEGIISDNLGFLAAKQGHSAEAARYYERALLIRREIGDRAGEAITLFNFGSLQEKLGQRVEAERCYRQALATYTELGQKKRAQVVAQALERLSGTDTVSPATTPVAPDSPPAGAMPPLHRWWQLRRHGS